MRGETGIVDGDVVAGGGVVAVVVVFFTAITIMRTTAVSCIHSQC